MKGIVFTEFIEMVESKFGLEMVNTIIDDADLASKGVYTSIGIYDFDELLRLVTALSKRISVPTDDLIFAYGEYFFDHLRRAHPMIFSQYHSPFDFLKSVEDHIHVQVRKIYPGAELPTFEITELDEKNIEMVYRSPRALYRFAEALIRKTFEHFDETCIVQTELLDEKGTAVRFVITQP